MVYSEFHKKTAEQLYDAVIVVDPATDEILYRNAAAMNIMPKDTPLPAALAAHLHTRNEPCSGELVLSAGTIPFLGRAVTARYTPVCFEGSNGLLITMICSDELVPDTSLAQQILEATHFLLVSVDAATMQTTVLQSNDPLLRAVNRFPNFSLFVSGYAGCALHPDDALTFTTALSEAACKRFLQGGIAPSVTLRCRVNDDWRWANYVMIRLDRNTLLLRCYYADLQKKQERSANYQRALETLSQRNSYILSCISDIFRLMLHVDPQSQATMICSMHKSLEDMFSYDMVYPFPAIAEMLLTLVHPDDAATLRAFSDLTQYQKPMEVDSQRIYLEYRRLTPSTSGGNDTEPKWTRSVIQLVGKKGEMPSALIYAVQDINRTKRSQLEAQHRQEDLKRKFDLLIRNRFLAFIESDYTKCVSECYRIVNGEAEFFFTCPFSQVFEKGFIPHCHPDDIKELAEQFLPENTMRMAAAGVKIVNHTYRFRHNDEWLWVRAEMHLYHDENGGLHSMIYIADVDKEIRAQLTAKESERTQMMLRKRFRLSVEDFYLSIDEVHLEDDTLYHYQLQDGNYVLVPNHRSFTQIAKTYPAKHLHPADRNDFERYFGYDIILNAARNRTAKLSHQFRFDLRGNGEYLWCSIVARFMRGENDTPIVLIYLQNIDAEVREREHRLQELEQAKQELQAAIRLAEQSRVRKAHFLINITADARLALNRINSLLEQMHDSIFISDEQEEEFNRINDACSHIERLIENMRDVLLLENHMLPLMKEPVSLPELFTVLMEKATPIIIGKHLNLTMYTEDVVNEIVYCDSNRLTHLIASIFLHLIRVLPNDADITLSLTQAATGTANLERFTLSIISCGDSFAQDVQKSLCTPLRALSGMNELECSMFAETGQNNLNMHINKKLIALMGGSLRYEQLTDHAGAVILSVPLSVAMEPPCVFPNLHLFNKRVMLIEPVTIAAQAMRKMLIETGMRIETPSSIDKAVAMLREAAAADPFDLLILPQSLLNEHQIPSLQALRAISPDTAFLIRKDIPATPAAQADAETVEALSISSPIFRTALARQLWTISSAKTAVPQHLGDLPNCSGKRVMLIAAKESILEQAAIAIQMAHAGVYKAWSGAQAVQMLSDSPERFYDMVLIDLQMTDEISPAEILSAIRDIKRDEIAALPIYGMTDQPTASLPNQLTGILQKPLQHDELEQLLTILSEMPSHHGNMTSGHIIK